MIKKLFRIFRKNIIEVDIPEDIKAINERFRKNHERVKKIEEIVKKDGLHTLMMRKKAL